MVSSYFIFHTVLMTLNKEIRLKIIYFHHAVVLLQMLNCLFVESEKYYLVMGILLLEITNPIQEIMLNMKLLNLKYTKIGQLFSNLFYCNCVSMQTSTSSSGPS